MQFYWILGIQRVKNGGIAQKVDQKKGSNNIQEQNQRDWKSLKYETVLIKNQMQTDRQNKIFSILKNTSDSLILACDNEKFIRKTYVLKREILKSLMERKNLIHPNLISLNQFEFSHFIDDQKIAVDIIFQYYCRTLNQCLIGPAPAWEDIEVINTFEPIISVIEYLLKQRISLPRFSLRNIAITQEQQIKYIDSFLFEREIIQMEISNHTNNFNSHQIYAQVADNIFQLLYPKFASKVWKTRLRVLKEQKSSALFQFVSSLVERSSSKGHDSLKKKKIRKTVKMLKSENMNLTQCQMVKYKKQQKGKICLIECNCFTKHNGKQNKVLQ